MPQSDKATPSTLRRTKSHDRDNVFSTPSNPTQTGTPSESQNCSSATKLVSSLRAASTPPERTNDGHLRQRSHTEGGSSQVTNSSTSWSRMTLSRKKSQYYDEAFAFRQANNTHKARAAKDSLIIAEVKLNCSIESEHEFQVDMAYLLSEIYQRPAACIMVLMNTDFSILLNVSAEPAYHITITALTPEIASTKNKRTTGLIHGFMLEAINVSASRGAIVFVPIPEENICANGSSFQQYKSADGGVIASRLSPMMSSEDKNQNNKRTPDLPKRAVTPSFWNDAIHYSRNARSTSVDNQDKKKVRRRKSFMALFGF